MRGKGEGAVFRVPKDPKQPLKYWQGVIELPSVDGDRRRKFIRRKDKRQLLGELEEKKAELRVRGDLPTSDQNVATWFTYWLNEIVAKEVRPLTAVGYRTVVTKYIIPTIGKVKLDKLTATHVRKVADSMTAAGLSSTYALNAHRIMSASFEVAVKEGRIGRNPAKLTNAPRKTVPKLDALDLDEAIRVIDHVSHDTAFGARWATALLTGARRGEVLGIERDRITDVLDLSWQLQRLIWQHGCGEIAILGKKGDPPTFIPKCNGKRGADCPQMKLNVPADFEYRRLTGGLYLTRPKSKAGYRVIPIVPLFGDVLERHMELNPPVFDGLLFTDRGRPVDPDQDSRKWRTVLAETGIKKDVRLHDLRHTAVDLLYAAEVPEDVIQQIIGHSTVGMTRSYKSRGKDPRVVRAMELYVAQFTRLDGSRRETLELSA